MSIFQKKKKKNGGLILKNVFRSQGQFINILLREMPNMPNRNTNMDIIPKVGHNGTLRAYLL